MTNIDAIKKFFAGERPVENKEIMALTKEDRQELGDAIRAQYGVEQTV